MHRQFRHLPVVGVVAPPDSLYGDIYAVPTAVADRKAVSIRI
jgi:hypothetical protein